MSLPETLRALAELAPAPTVPPGIFDRVRRRRRQRRLWAAAAVMAVVAVAATGYGVGLRGHDDRQFAAGPAGLPRTVFDPPMWTEEFSASPNGPASVVFWGPTVAIKPVSHGNPGISTAVVGLTRDSYRVVYPKQPPAVLSPDGRTLLMPRLDLGNSSEMMAEHWRTDALDLVTGRRRAVASRAVPVSWSVDGRHLVLVQPYYWPGRSTGGPTDDIVSIVGWPSAQVDWSVRIARPQAIEGESNYHLALSPDASMLAVTTSRELRVYRRDGTLLWHRDVGWDVLAGPAAWRDDGRLAVMRRDLPGCPRCPLKRWTDPSDWRMEFVSAATGDPVPGPAYPVLSSAFALRVIGWRGDTAYAVARSNRDGEPVDIQASLVRLAPGAAAPESVLALPHGVSDLNVAVDYLDAVRPAESPTFGLSIPQVLVIAFRAIPPVAAATAIIAWWLWRRRQRIERQRVPRAP